MSLLRQKSKIAVFLSAVLIFSLVSGIGTSAIKPVRCRENEEKMIALTFDDGPHGRYTGEILDILTEYGIKATFFVIGQNCLENEDILKRISEEGHEIGNHTFSHPINKNLSEAEMKAELTKTDKLIDQLVGKKPVLFRPPGGMYTKAASRMLDGLNYTPILWNVDTRDWKCPRAEAIAETVIGQTKSGSIILCHDYVSGKSSTPEALRIFLPVLLEKGYRFVTVSELLECCPGKQ